MIRIKKVVSDELWVCDINFSTPVVCYEVRWLQDGEDLHNEDMLKPSYSNCAGNGSSRVNMDAVMWEKWLLVIVVLPSCDDLACCWTAIQFCIIYSATEVVMVKLLTTQAEWAIGAILISAVNLSFIVSWVVPIRENTCISVFIEFYNSCYRTTQNFSNYGTVWQKKTKYVLIPRIDCRTKSQPKDT